MLTAGDQAGATPLLKQIEGYKDVTDLLHRTAYQLASQLKAAGDYRQAAEQFSLIRGYEDADAQAEECYDLYYADAYRVAEDALKDKDYKAALEALEPLDRENPGEKYRDVQEMYQDAVYRYANQLHMDGKSYEALPYYRKILDYKDVTSYRLTRRPFMVLGSWESVQGTSMTFREDGTCAIDGRELYFSVRNNLITIGDRQDELTDRYIILVLNEDTFNLRRESPRTTYKMSKVEVP